MTLSSWGEKNHTTHTLTHSCNDDIRDLLCHDSTQQFLHPISVWEVWEEKVRRRFNGNRRWPRTSDARSVATIQRLLQGVRTPSSIPIFHTDNHYYFSKSFDGFVFNTSAIWMQAVIWEGCGCLGFTSLKHRPLSSQLAHSMSFSVSDCCTTTVRMPGFEWRWKGTAWKCAEANSILGRRAVLPPRAPFLQPRRFKWKQMLLKGDAKQPGNTCELILVLLQQTEAQKMIK